MNFRRPGAIVMLLTIALNSYIFSQDNQICISEILAVNRSVNVDQDYSEFGDWIEISNTGNNVVNIGSWWLSDDAGELMKWQIPTGAIIPPHSQLLFWADNKDVVDKEMHLNFKLSSKGETVFLSDHTGLIMDSLSFAEQLPDFSFGKDFNNDQTVYFEKPTPLQANSQFHHQYNITANKPDFSKPGGLYTAPIQLVLSGDGPGNDIYYTLNGSIPTRNSNLYKSPIDISQNRIIRARIFSDTCLPGEIVTQSYIFAGESTLPVININTHPDFLFDNNIGILSNPHSDWKRPANIEFYTSAGMLQFNQIVEIKLHGNKGVAYPQQCFSLEAQDHFGDDSFDYQFFTDKNIQSFNSFILRNSSQDWYQTLMRCGTMNSIVAGKMNIDYQSYTPSLVFLNGDFWGIYNIREKMNEDYVTSNYGYDKEDIEMLEDDMLVINGDTAHYSHMYHYIATANMLDSATMDSIAMLMDVDEFIDYQIAEIFFGNTDWPERNIKYWRPDKENGRWRWMMFDLDFGFAGNPPIDHNTLEWATRNVPCCMLLRRLLMNPVFRHEFIQRFAMHMNSTFTYERMNQLIDSIKNTIQLEMHRQIVRWKTSGGIQSIDQWESDVSVMKDFAEYRTDYVRQHIQNKFYISSTVEISVSWSGNDGGKILIQDIPVASSNFSGIFFKGIPLRIKAVPKPGYYFVEWAGISSEQELLITPNENISLEAVFAPYQPGGGVYINEFMADNKHFMPDEYGDFEDWIEIYNGSSDTIDLGGMYITDDLTIPDKHLIPTGYPDSTSIAPDGYLILFADEDPEEGIWHLNFKLEKNGEEIGLFNNDGATLIDTVSFGNQLEDQSFGRIPDGSDSLSSFEVPTPNKTNQLLQKIDLCINEFMSANCNTVLDPEGEFEEWIEIHNPSQDTLNLGGMYVTTDRDQPGKFRIPDTCMSETAIPPGEFMILWFDGELWQGPNHVALELDSCGGFIGISDPGGNYYVDSLSYLSQQPDISSGRFPDGHHDVVVLTSPSPGLSNNVQSVPLLFINEMMADNDTTIADPQGDYEDWIEIYNAGFDTIDLGGYYMTDDLSNPDNFMIPGGQPQLTTIPPGGFLLFWADKDPEDGALHLDFKLDKDGEQIGLFAPDGITCVDTLSFYQQSSDISLGRLHDGGDSLTYMYSATPGFSNNQQYPVGVKVFLEGAYSPGEMQTHLNDQGLLPSVQPFDCQPWNYDGGEMLTSPLPSEMVDWVLVELRQTTGGPETATSSTRVGRKAALLMSDGMVYDLDSASPVAFDVEVTDNLYVIVHHRNHIPVMSAQAINGAAVYDFTSGPDQAFGGLNGHKQIEAGVFGMAGGDADSDGQVGNSDKNDVWSQQAGNSGYLSADMNLDGQVNNADKNDVWKPNSGFGSQVMMNGTGMVKGFRSQVPK